MVIGVRGFADEPVLTLEGSLRDSVEHRVQRCRKVGRLAAAVLRHASVQVAVSGDGVGRSRHLAHQFPLVHALRPAAVRVVEHHERHREKR
jgi:hypothetical protein